MQKKFMIPQCGKKNKNKTKKEKNYMMTWHVIPRYINLGPHISLS